MSKQAEYRLDPAIIYQADAASRCSSGSASAAGRSQEAEREIIRQANLLNERINLLSGAVSTMEERLRDYMKASPEKEENDLGKSLTGVAFADKLSAMEHRVAKDTEILNSILDRLAL